MNCPSCATENVEGARFCAKCGALMPTDEAEERDTLLGQTVGERYTIKRVLGEGGMGRVYEAERSHHGVTQRYAVKTLHPHLSKDPQVLERFQREFRTVAGLKHPSTIKVEDFGQTPDGTLYIAMEFVDGTSVAKELEKGAMPPERVERIMGQVCGSLAEAHKKGIIHRDLKPENVVLMNVGDEADFVKVLDFGIAARKDKVDAAKEQKLTQQGMVLGTPPYMSPEQFMGKELDSRSDIYSLGVMAYEMLTGRLPFDANTPWEWATKHMTAQPFPFEDSPTVTDVPGKMKSAILHALEKDPTKRHANVKEFFEDLSGGGGGYRTGSIASQAEVQPGPTGGETASMTPYEAEKGRTQIGTPMSFEGGSGSIVPGVPVAPLPPPPPQPQATGGGGNKGLLIGLGVVGGGLVLVSMIGIAVKMSGSKDSISGLEVPSSTGATTVTPLTSGTTGAIAPPASADPTATATHHVTGPTTTTTATATSTGLTKPPATALKGDEACNDAARRGGNGDVLGGVGSYQRCTGSGRENARRAIAASVPGAVRNAAFSGDCRKARSIAAAGSSVGSSVNVDQQYPQCKGK
jgi:eukaryotic-like serine/threonine-protein kinase